MVASTGIPPRLINTPFGPASEVPLDIFLGCILPPPRLDINPGEVLTILKNNKAITKRNRWRGFAADTLPPSKHLEAIVKSIVKASNGISGGVKPILHFQNSLSSTMAYRDSSNDAFPDVAFLGGDFACTWENVAVCGEYEEGELSGDREVSIPEVTECMANCMRRDPRRRHVFAFTMKGAETRLWFCDREKILTSQPFDFFTDHLSWVRFCLSLLYAPPHKLGWDTTMTPLHDGSNFDIAIRSADGQTRLYRTRSLLSRTNFGDRLGKGTRVWRAVRVENDIEVGPPVALKDSWVYAERTREGDTIRRIRQAARSLGDADTSLKEFANVEWHGDVFIGDDEPSLDCTRSFTYGEPVQDIDSKPSGPRLVHYRMVLTQVGEASVEYLKPLPLIYAALSHAADTLRLLHKCGWVHRDVSTGNILYGLHSPLVDYEYAKQASEEENFDVGTRFFKAFEVDREFYYYKPRPQSPTQPTMSIQEFREFILNKISKESTECHAEPSRSRAGEQSKPKETQCAVQNPPPPPLEDEPFIEPLRYNPLHDLESLWWVAVYFLLKREIQRSASDAAESEAAPKIPITSDCEDAEDAVKWDREKQRKLADDVFYTNDARSTMMRQNSSFFYTQILAVLHPQLYPVLNGLEDLRRDLVDRYTEVEKNPASIDFTCADGLHERFVIAFSEIENNPNLKDVLLAPLAAVPPPFFANVDRVAEEPPQFDSRPAQGAEKGQTGKKETKKAPKARQRRKSVSTIPTHRYNLRPRAGRG